MSNSGLSGIQASFVRQSVSSNNVSNLRTNGFKSSRADQVESETGGTSVESITRDNRQGALVSTGRNLDLAIQGEGFFLVNKGGEQRLTRSGSFDVDAEGNVVNQATGGILQGKKSPNGPIQNLKIKESERNVSPKVTDSATLSGNVNANLENGESVSTSVDLTNSLGNTKTATFEFTKTSADTVKLTVEDPETGKNALEAKLTFGSSGQIESTNVKNSPNSGGSFNGLFMSTSDGSAPVKISGGKLDFSAVTKQAGDSSVQVASVSGRSSGELESLNVTSSGKLRGSFSNGEERTLGIVQTATVRNPGGLESTSGGLLKTTANSGKIVPGQPDTGGRGSLRSGFLEASNVNLAGEILDQLTSQRSLNASVSTVETKDEMVGELLDLTR
ncbi:MAG: flagellar hook-basal body complex protein [bacterium]